MLLSETELRAALEPLLDRLLGERLRLFQLQQEPRLQALIQAALQPMAQAGGPEALGRLVQTTSPGQCFNEMFEQAGGLVGERRTLWVEYRGQRAVWQRAGEPLAAPEGLAIAVRQRTVGRLEWPAGVMPPALRPRMELLTAVAGLVLLRQGMAAAESASGGTKTEEAAPAAKPHAAPAVAAEREAAANAEERFARLLVEDLRVYLQHERAAELAAARGAGEFQQHFAAEWERLRRAFLERYPHADVSLLEEELAFFDWR